MREIIKIHGNKPSHWVGDGFFVCTLLSHFNEDPDFNYRHTDPFLLLDYAAPKIFLPNPHYDTHPYGVGQHPHKGFETVTIAYAGQLSHTDSAGGYGTIAEGDVQWMTAGRGVIHEEFHSTAFGQYGGVLSMVQLWINLPQADKLTAPSYQTLRRANMPVIELINEYENSDNGKNIIGKLTLIAGEYQGKTGAATTFTPINLWDIELLAAGLTTLDVPNNHNVMLLVQEGELLINDTPVNAGQLIQFTAPTKHPKYSQNEHSQIEHSSTDTIELRCPAAADDQLMPTPVKLLLLSGEPIGEPIASHGPFVMTTADELKQTFHDYQTGNFG